MISNSHIGKTCPFCQFPIKQDSEAVQCPACKVPHHRECWEQNEGCTSFGCLEKTYRETAEKRLEISFDEPSGQQAETSNIGGTNKLLAGAMVTALIVIAVLGGYIFMGINEQAIPPDLAKTDTGGPDQADYPVFDDLDADYYIDYENGTIPLGDLPIGARVVDPSWEWEFKTGENYSGWGGSKPVTWIVVAKNHYDELDGHVTLHSEELIGRHAFDNSAHVRDWGYNHWGESGTHSSATRGLRPWLNSTGIHSGEGFYRAFSESFKQAVLVTNVSNREWQSGSVYNTNDYVFIPSTTELGDSDHELTYRIGSVYAYFSGVGDAKRIALLGGEVRRYWTRSPASNYGGAFVRHVSSAGDFYDFRADNDYSGVRPALNLKSEILVSEIID